MEQLEHDGLGRTLSWTYSAIDVDAGQPVQGQWGDIYCNGVWSAACSKPLFEMHMRYDIQDRVVSYAKAFGHPVVSPSTSNHERRWKGYGYNGRGFLSKEWEASNISLGALNAIPHHLNTDADADVAQFSNSQSGTGWNWERDVTGDLTSISMESNPSIKRWEHENSQGGGERLVGHQLETVKTAYQGNLTIQHDERGRVINDGMSTYWFDASDKLVASKSNVDTEREVYVYDAMGRMIQIIREDAGLNDALDEILVYDGWQMLASYQDGQLAWEATWGAGVDHLVEWRHVNATGGEVSYIPVRDRRQSIVGLWNTSTYKLEGLSEYTAQGHRTTLDQHEAVTCEEEGTGVVCDTLQGAFPFGFNTAWRSFRSGLYHMRHRWYSPILGQFASHDPLEYIDSPNMYSFASHDAVNRWDPLGLESITLADVIDDFTPVTRSYIKSKFEGEEDLKKIKIKPASASLLGMGGAFNPITNTIKLSESDYSNLVNSNMTQSLLEMLVHEATHAMIWE